jgi:hypothetical protein
MIHSVGLFAGVFHSLAAGLCTASGLDRAGVGAVPSQILVDLPSANVLAVGSPAK